MAVVKITVEDAPDGQVHITAESDPPFRTKDAEENTDAQVQALLWLQSSVDEAETVHDVFVSD